MDGTRKRAVALSTIESILAVVPHDCARSLRPGSASHQSTSEPSSSPGSTIPLLCASLSLPLSPSLWLTPMSLTSPSGMNSRQIPSMTQELGSQR